VPRIARNLARPRTVVAALLATLAAATVGWMTLASGASTVPATTPVKHLVVIFDENVSYDHYFGTYPTAINPPGEPAFTAAPGTPIPNGLQNDANANPHAPVRIDRANALTCDQNHAYSDEQSAVDGGLMDKFEQYTAGGSCVDKSIVMDYFDGNTVTALWNLAQHFALSDNFRGTTYGPSTPGALNLVSGNTHGVTPAGAGVNGTITSDPDPALDDCGSGSAKLTGRNVGDLLNDKGVTWGWFQGGFRRTSVDGSGKASCASAHANVGGGSVGDYSAHHEPFQYYASTANPHHLPPSSVAAIGTTDQANHQYDLADFDDVVAAGDLPQVSFLKAASFEDAHAGYSDPLDEQHFVARALDEVEQSPDWASTAVVIAYDDSDGWYDHDYLAPSQYSNDAADKAVCTGGAVGVGDYLDRCGPGPRLPLLVVSPWTAPNTVHSLPIEQTSILKFIETNWSLPQIGDRSFDARAGALDPLFDFDAGHARAPKVFLDPSTGQVLSGPPSGLVSSPNGPDPAAPVVVPPVVVSPAVPAPAPVPPAKPVTPAPVVGKLKPKFSGPVTVKRSGKHATLALKLSGLTASRGKITVTAKLILKKKTVATAASATLKSGKAKLTLKAKKAIKKGKYTLSVTVKQAGAAATVTKSVTLR
jgi:phospholipase C